MAEKPASDLANPALRALVGLAIMIALPLVGAQWLNGWRLFAFPLGTFLLAMVVPFALIGLAMILCQSDDEAEDPTTEADAS